MGYGNSSFDGGYSQGLGSIGNNSSRSRDVDVDPADIGHDLAHGGNGLGLQGSGEQERSWSMLDGWHNISTRASTPSYNGGLMSTVYGSRHPGAYARDRRQFNIAQKRNLFNQQAGFMDDMIDQINNRVNKQQNWWTREPELEKQQLRNGLSKKAYMGEVGSLRDTYGFDTSAMENAFSGTGFMDKFSSMFGGKPDNVDTFGKQTQEMIDKGLLEWNDDNSLELTNKGKFTGIGKMAVGPFTTGATNLAYSIGGPTAGQAANLVAQGGAYTIGKAHPSAVGGNIAEAMQNAAPLAASYDFDLGKALIGFSPIGSMYDTFSYAKQLDNMGIAPGGQSYFQRQPSTGQVLDTNYDVVNNSIDQAVRSIKGGSSSEFYPQDFNQPWPAENSQQLWPGEGSTAPNLTYPQWMALYWPWF